MIATVSNTNKDKSASEHRIYICEMCDSECFLAVTADQPPTSCPFNGDMQPVWEELDPEDENE